MRIDTQLSGARVALTGVTGFVGQALLARLLDDVSSCDLVVLCRERSGQPASDRIADLLASGSAFERRRERNGGSLDGDLERLEVVTADLDDDRPLVLPPIDVLIHVAGTVSFDTRIDEAFETHVTGVNRLYEAARAVDCDHVVHVSTAYVAAREPGPIPERAVRDDLDWRMEAAAAAELARQAEASSRQPARLERFLAQARRRSGAHGDQELGRQAESARRTWVREQLVDAGRQRARTLGFADVYTMTKAMGEVVAQQWFGEQRLTVVRPTIVESARSHPYPGWIEGFKVADPLIVGLGRGDIPEFPGFPDGVVDLVPVDHVANALVVAAARPPAVGQTRYVTVGTGARNPLTLHRIYQLVRDHYDRNPLPGHADRSTVLPTWRFPGADATEWQLRTATRLSRAGARAIELSPITGRRIRQLGRTIDRHERRFEALSRFLDLYGIYAQTESVFLDDEAAALHDSLAPDDREVFGFDPTVIDWQHYLDEVHIPSVSAVFRIPRPRRRSKQPPALTEANSGPPVLAVFDLDGTVADTDVLSTYLSARWADDRASFAGAAFEVVRSLPRYAALDAVGRERFLRAFYRRFEGADVAALEDLVRRTLGQRLLHELSPHAIRRIREHRARGHRTVLLTGALRTFCEPIETLFDDIAAADLEVDERGRATGHLCAPPLVGATRANWLRDYARQHGADLSASYAYADSRSDVPMLRSVGHPVAVDPDVALDRLARQQRWAIATWRDAGTTSATVS